MNALKFGLSPLVLSASLGLLVACGGSGSTTIDTGSPPETFTWNIPSNYPLPVVPADNPITEEKFQLGRHLFYDKRLSGNGTASCSSCHLQALAFTDGLAHGIGAVRKPWSM